MKFQTKLAIIKNVVHKMRALKLKNLANFFIKSSAHANHSCPPPYSSKGFGHLAFTLAEALITLTIIGVIAAITIPSLKNAIDDFTYSKADSTFQRRLGEALKMMNANAVLAKHETTESFVNELKDKMTIVKVCSSSKITECFGQNFKSASGETKKTINVSELSTVNKLTKADYGNSEVLGIVFKNGISALVAYNKNADQEPYNNNFITFSNSDGVVSVGTDALAILYDLDGKGGGENLLGRDIRGINVAFSGTCPGSVRTIEGKNYCDLGTNYSASGTYMSGTSEQLDYWTGAKKACAALGGTLPTWQQLGLLHGRSGAPTSGDYWSSVESSATYAYTWFFSSGNQGNHLKNGKYSVLCTGGF